MFTSRQDGIDGAVFRAQSAMQAMLLADHIRTSGRNALLRTASHAFSASDAVWSDHKALFCREADLSAADRAYAEIEPFHLLDADAEWLQDVTADARIDIIHGRIVVEDLIDPSPLIAQLLRSSADAEHLKLFVQSLTATYPPSHS